MEVKTMSNERKIYGVAALFTKPDDIINAASKVANEGYSKWDVNTPYPLHGMDNAMKLKPSKIGFITLLMGLSGAATALMLAYFTNSIDFPLVIGGKPFFSLPAYIPITFELTVLFATVSTVIAMLTFFFKFPSNNHVLHDTQYMKKVSLDRYGIVIEAIDPKFEQSKVEELLRSFDPESVETIYHKEVVKFPIFEPKFISFLIIVAIAVSAGTYITLNKLMFMVPFNWMMNQDKIIPQSRTELFEDERGMRPPVKGTVAKGFIPYTYMGIDEPQEYFSNPHLPSIENLKLGEKKYLTYCSPCHGNFGDGDSRLKGQFPNPPTLHSQRIRSFEDGRFYHIITIGKNIMPSYAAQISREERWAIVNYIRVLQKAKNATAAELEMIIKETGTNVAN
jgi:mono/diheme cytochrome c family protein